MGQTQREFLYSSLGCIVGQTQREAVAEGKHKPRSFFVVLHSPAGPGPGVPGSAGSQAGQPWSPNPRRAYRCAEAPGARDVELDRVPAGERTSGMKTGESET